MVKDMTSYGQAHDKLQGRSQWAMWLFAVEGPRKIEAAEAVMLRNMASACSAVADGVTVHETLGLSMS